MNNTQNMQFNDNHKKLLKENKRTELLFNALKDKRFLSEKTLQVIRENIAWQKGENAFLDSEFLYLEKCSNRFAISSAVMEINNKNLLDKIKAKVMLYVTLIMIDTKVMILKVQ